MTHIRQTHESWGTFLFEIIEEQNDRYIARVVEHEEVNEEVGAKVYNIGREVEFKKSAIESVDEFSIVEDVGE